MSESTPAVVDSSGAPVRDASGDVVASSGPIRYYEDAVVLYEVVPYVVEPALPAQSSLDESWSGNQVAGAASDPATGFD